MTDKLQKAKRRRTPGSVGAMSQQKNFPKGYVQSHRVPVAQASHAFYLEISAATGSTVKEGRLLTPWDIDGAADNGQPLAGRGEKVGVTEYFPDPSTTSSQAGSHPRLNDFVGTKFTEWNVNLQTRLASNPSSEHNRIRLEFAERARNLSDAIALSSVDGFVTLDNWTEDPLLKPNANTEHLRLVYNRTDPNAKLLWSEWDTLTNAQKDLRINALIDHSIGAVINSSGDIHSGTKKAQIKILRDLTQGEVGWVKPGLAELADRIFAEAGQEVFNRNVFDIVEDMSQEQLGRVLEGRNGKLFAEAQAAFKKGVPIYNAVAAYGIGNGEFLVRLAGETIDGALTALDFVEVGGVWIRSSQGKIEFDPLMKLPDRYVGGVHDAIVTILNGGDRYIEPSYTSQYNLSDQSPGNGALIQTEAQVMLGAAIPAGINMSVTWDPTLGQSGEWGLQFRRSDGTSVRLGFWLPPGHDPDAPLQPGTRAASLNVLGDNSIILNDYSSGTTTVVDDKQHAELLELAIGGDTAAISRLGEINTAKTLENEGRYRTEGEVTEELAASLAYAKDVEADAIETNHKADQFATASAANALGSIWSWLTRTPDTPTARDIGLAFGTALGRMLVDDDPVLEIVTGSLLGATALEFGAALGFEVGSPTAFGGAEGVENATESGWTAFKDNYGQLVQGAAIGSFSSYFAAELGETLGLEGLTADVFNAGVGGVLQLALNNFVPQAGVFSLLEGANLSKAFSKLQSLVEAPGQIGGAFANGVQSFFTAKLASNVVSAETQAGAVLGSLGSAIGSAYLGPVGSFVGQVIGTFIGNLFGRRNPRIPVADAEVVLALPSARYELGAQSAVDNGDVDLVLSMATASRDTLNGLIELITQSDEDAIVSNTWSPTQAYGHSGGQLWVKLDENQNGTFQTSERYDVDSADEAVDMGVLWALPATEIIGGDLYLKRALYDQVRNPGQAPNIATLAGDLQIAEDYAFYLKNRAIIDAAIAEPYTSMSGAQKTFYDANKAFMTRALAKDRVPLSSADQTFYAQNQAMVDSIISDLDLTQFAAAWIVTLQRAAELELDRTAKSDLHGGMGGFYQSLKLFDPPIASPNLFEDSEFEGGLGSGFHSVFEPLGAGQSFQRSVDASGVVSLSIASPSGPAPLSGNYYWAGDYVARGDYDTSTSVPWAENAFATSPGETVVASLDARVLSSGGRVLLYMYFYDETNTAVGWSSNYMETANGDSNWTRLEVHGTAPANTAYAVMYYYGYAHAADGASAQTSFSAQIRDPMIAKAPVGVTSLPYTTSSLDGRSHAEIASQEDIALRMNFTEQSLDIVFDANRNGRDDAGEQVVHRLEDFWTDAGYNNSGTWTTEGGYLKLNPGATNNGNKLYDLSSQSSPLYVWNFADAQTPLGGDTIIVGGIAGDQLIGAAGADWLDGGVGDDQLFGNDGADVILGRDGVDLIQGGGGDDILFGGDGSEEYYSPLGVRGIYGGPGNDRLDGGKGNDHVWGEDGDDTFIVDPDDGGAWDYYMGGNGSDTVTFEKLAAGITFDLANFRVPNSPDYSLINGDYLHSIENLRGTDFVDSIGGDGTANRLNGGAGDDLLYGYSGDDVLEGDSGADLIHGGGQWDTASYEHSPSAVWVDFTVGEAFGGDAEGDTYYEVEHITGSKHADTLKGNTGYNILKGGDGDDWLIASTGGDYFVGGAGFDTLDFSEASGGVTVASGSYSGAAGSGSHSEIEHFVGSDSADSMTGGSGDDWFQGGKGNDTLSGGDGSDTYIFNAGDGYDTIIDNNTHANTLLLGDGITWTDMYFSTSTNLVISLFGGTDQITISGNFATPGNNRLKLIDMGGAGSIDVSEISWAAGGTSSNDTVSGHSYDKDWLAGYDGADTIRGAVGGAWEQNGNVIIGGRGNDYVITSVGDDQFVFERGHGRDIIDDSGGIDTLVFGPTVATEDVIFHIGQGDTDLYVAVRDLAAPTLTAKQIWDANGDAIRIIDGGAYIYVWNTDPYEPDYNFNGFNTVEHIIAGGASIDLMKLGLDWQEVYIGGPYQPIVFDLGDDGLDLISVENSKVVLKGDDQNAPLMRVGWVDGQDGILAIDRNGDGQISRMSEISFRHEKEGAQTDLEGLAGLDSNKDGVINAKDARWGELKMWRDVNENGLGKGKEIVSLDEAGISEIELKLSPTGFDGRNTTDNTSYNTALFHWASGKTGTVHDVALASKLAHIEGRLTGRWRDEWAVQPVDGDLGRAKAADGVTDAQLVSGKAEIAPIQSLTFVEEASEDGAFDLPDIVSKKGSAMDLAEELAGGRPVSPSAGSVAPIAIDLDGDGVQLVAPEDSHVMFDVNQDGWLDQIGWVGARDGILAYDRDGDGAISLLSEISFLEYKSGATSDLDGLSAFDTNLDGEFSRIDDAWGHFLIWRDGNQDGESSASELLTLEQAGITSIALGGYKQGNIASAGVARSSPAFAMERIELLDDRRTGSALGLHHDERFPSISPTDNNYALPSPIVTENFLSGVRNRVLGQTAVGLVAGGTAQGLDLALGSISGIELARRASTPSALEAGERGLFDSNSNLSLWASNASTRRMLLAGGSARTLNPDDAVWSQPSSQSRDSALSSEEALDGHAMSSTIALPFEEGATAASAEVETSQVDSPAILPADPEVQDQPAPAEEPANIYDLRSRYAPTADRWWLGRDNLSVSQEEYDHRSLQSLLDTMAAGVNIAQSGNLPARGFDRIIPLDPTFLRQSGQFGEALARFKGRGGAMTGNISLHKSGDQTAIGIVPTPWSSPSNTRRLDHV